MFRDSYLKTLKGMRRGTRREEREKFDIKKRRRETTKEKKLVKNLWILLPYPSISRRLL